MSGNYIKLYAASSAADAAFFLSEGAVFLYPSNVDNYAIRGRNLVFGSTEIILNKLGGMSTARIETAIADPSSVIKRIAVDNFLKSLGSFSFGLNVLTIIAKQIMLTNQIIQKNLSVLKDDENKTRKFSTEYYLIISRLQEEYEKRKYPWLKILIGEFSDSLTYKRGEAYHKSSEPVRLVPAASLSDKDVEFPKGALICEENTTGNEMYILKSGSLDVIIQGNRVATIDQPGTVIGEMALLLGETRSATLQAKNTVVMTRLFKEDLKEAVLKQADFLPNVAQTLAKRHYYNILKIDHINKAIIEQDIDKNTAGKKEMLHSEKTFKDLQRLKQKAEDTALGKHADFLKKLIDTF
jgi:CRP-like cAMP-binding protein